VKVRRNEGVATHIDPKPCAGIREDVGEASAGECTGQPAEMNAASGDSALGRQELHIAQELAPRACNPQQANVRCVR